MKKRRVAVLAGGWSRERAVSLRSGKAVLLSLKKAGWDASALDLAAEPGLQGARRSAAPAWCSRVTPSALIALLRRRGIQMVFPMLHGPFGEDGRVQGLLEMAGIAFAGSGSRASALAMDKYQCKATLAVAGIAVPRGRLIIKGQTPPAWRLPCVLKPCSEGSSFGVTLAKTAKAYQRGIQAALAGGGRALVEDYVLGREFTVGVVGDTALPVVEIIPGNEIYDTESKYGPAGYEHLVPASILAAKRAAMQRVSLKVHRLLGCRGFSRVDLMMGRGGVLKVIEVNTLPGMTKDSLLPDAARAAGWSMETLVINMMKHSLKEQ